MMDAPTVNSINKKRFLYEQMVVAIGYIRNMEDAFDDLSIPSDIQQLCIEYYIINCMYFVSSRLGNNATDICKTVDTVFQELGSDPSGRIYFSDTPISKTNKIYQWSFKCIDFRSNDQIGIINKIDTINKMYYLFEEYD
eukprot:23270_1